MSTFVLPTETAVPVADRLILRDVSWETYEQLLANYVDTAGPRLAYDRGALEIMSPSSEHEELAEIITQLVYILAEEWGIEYRNFGRTTFRRRETESGFEPDSCFYIQSVEAVQGVRRLDPAVHPPPDLVVEVDITTQSLRKLPIYARMNVPEVWRCTETGTAILVLREGSFVESEVSASIPRLGSDALPKLVEQSRTMKRSAWVRTVREWARSSF